MTDRTIKRKLTSEHTAWMELIACTRGSDELAKRHAAAYAVRSVWIELFGTWPSHLVRKEKKV